MAIKVDYFLRVDRGFSFREVWTAAGTLYLASNRPQVRIHLLHLLVNDEMFISHHIRLLLGSVLFEPESSQNRMMLIAQLLGKDKLLYFGDNRV